MSEIKQQIRAYWDAEPCGTGGIRFPQGSREYYEAIAINRYRKERFIVGLAEFDRWRGKKVLEVGCGAGSDLAKFAEAGADITGIDLSSQSVDVARSRLRVYGLPGRVLVADAESLPFNDGEFDMVYSCGVLHHTPDVGKAIAEVRRVLKSGGEIRIMLYHKPSLVCLQMWIKYGLLRGHPFRSVDDIFYYHHESVGTKVYTVGMVRRLFSEFRNVRVETVATLYDIRYAKNKFLPRWVQVLVPNGLGWNVLIKGQK